MVCLRRLASQRRLLRRKIFEMFTKCGALRGEIPVAPNRRVDVAAAERKSRHAH